MDVFVTKWFRTRRSYNREKPQEAITMKFEKDMNERLVRLDPEHPFMLRPQVCSWYDRSERELVVVASPSEIQDTDKLSLYQIVEGSRIHRFTLIMPTSDLPYEDLGDGSKVAIMKRWENRQAAQNLGLI